MAQPAFLGGFLEAGGGEETVGPTDQLLAVARRARAQLVEMARRFDQRVFLLVLLLQQRIEQAFADAERREHHLPRLADAQNVFEHQRRIGQQRPPRIVDHFDIRQRIDVDPVHELGEFKRLVGGDGIAVHHVQRIAGLPHVQPRQRPPGAADGVEAAVLAGLQHRQAAQRLLDEFFRLLDRLRRNIGERQPAERAGQAVARARAADIDEFERAAAEIADHAVGAMHAGNHAERGELGLAPARQHVDIGADGAFGELDEGRAVFGVAAGGRGDSKSFRHAHRVTERAKALERRQRVLHRVRGQQAGRLHFAAEPAQRLFVENLGRAAGEPLIDDKAHGIRADVDDGNRRTVVETSLGVGCGAAHRSIQRKSMPII